jgi:hypothetical protein
LKTTAKKPTKFDKLIAQAAALLVRARDAKNADDLSLGVRRGRAPMVDLYWEERELEGQVTDSGVKLGRKP